MSLKKIAFKSSILFPVIVIIYLFWKPFRIYIGEINLDIWDQALPFCFLIFTVLWLNFSPCRKGCRGGNVFELLFNLFPIEVLLTLVFAQYHFIISIVIFAIILTLILAFWLSIKKDELKRNADEKEHQQNLRIGRRFFVLVSAVILLVPCICSLFVYQLKEPFYVANADLLTDLLYSDEAEDTSETYNHDNIGFVDCFRESLWTGFSTEEKITLLQMLADYETNKLGVPNVPITTERIDMITLGEYNTLTDTICIDLEHLQDSDVERTVNTLLHEVYHAYQNYIIKSIDWGADYAGSAYFAEARAWKINNENYINGVVDYDEYENQPLEISAREYAEKECSALFELITQRQSP